MAYVNWGCIAMFVRQYSSRYERSRTDTRPMAMYLDDTVQGTKGQGQIHCKGGDDFAGTPEERGLMEETEDPDSDSDSPTKTENRDLLKETYDFPCGMTAVNKLSWLRQD